MDKKNKLVSIIVPIYNSEETLEKCISSLQNQTYQDYELILVNDGSTDSSKDICDSIAKKSNNVRVIHTSNKGVSNARNLGIKYAKGKYIQFVDSDDFCELNMSETLIKKIQNSDSELIICGYYINKTNKMTKRCVTKDFEVKSVKSMNFLYENYMLHPLWNKLYLKERIKILFDTNISIAEDLLFNIEYMKNCNKIEIISDVLYHYNVSKKESLSKKIYKNAIDINGIVFEKMKEFYTKFFNIKENVNFETINRMYYLDLKNLIENYAISKEINNEEKEREIQKIIDILENNNLLCNYNNYILYYLLKKRKIELIIKIYKIKYLIKRKIYRGE
mgnify:CR=1 FL=1